MGHDLSFEKIALYDSGKPGISIPVEIRIGAISVTVNAKVDTGATYCVFAKSVGESLGIEIASGEPKKISTVMGSFRVFGHFASLITEGFIFDSPIYFSNDDGYRLNVLGRHGWLDRVIVGINDYDGKLYLNRYPNS